MSLMQSDLRDIPLLLRGKVRDVYDLGDKLLIIATDRISAFDWVLPNGIPGKGKILTSISIFWFNYTRDIIENHLLTVDVDSYPPQLKPYRDQLEGRSMLVRKAKRIDIECVARGYIIGSGYKDYIKQKPGNGKINLHGNILPMGLKLADKLPCPIFTPATKEKSGHDINISLEEMARMVGKELTLKLKDISLAVYTKAAEYALKRGIIIADTKFEFGFDGERLILIDEILSPDSSRFWPLTSYKPGVNPESFDKQYVRDWLENTDWDKNSPPPEMPQEIIDKTLEKYKEAHRLLVGKDIDD
ncbi:MAG: phosphoribosylaminoimidazolesuccinocarboxamide synthase [candidate division Zixibacteria bacterium 4484_95]|nr:MAG: phosphoribosylaminoimidazolesuccinocarboxamide synthase [candidate division Zixibacteria bacterium 4484_95]